MIAGLQIVAEFAQGAAIARHQHQAIAVAREQVRQFQSNAARCTGDQGRLGRKKRIACSHCSFIADFGVTGAGTRNQNSSHKSFFWVVSGHEPSVVPNEEQKRSGLYSLLKNEFRNNSRACMNQESTIYEATFASKRVEITVLVPFSANCLAPAKTGASGAQSPRDCRIRCGASEDVP